MPRTRAHPQVDQYDLLLDDIERFREVHRGQAALFEQHAADLRSENESLRVVIASSYSAVMACRGLPMTPSQRERIGGAIVSMRRAVGIKPAAVAI